MYEPSPRRRPAPARDPRQARRHPGYDDSYDHPGYDSYDDPGYGPLQDAVWQHAPDPRQETLTMFTRDKPARRPHLGIREAVHAILSAAGLLVAMQLAGALKYGWKETGIWLAFYAALWLVLTLIARYRATPANPNSPQNETRL